MNRQSTLQKEAIIIKEFQRLLRSGKDYSVCSMYEDAGKKCIPVIVAGTVGNIIRNHYRGIIKSNPGMYNFVKDNQNLSFKCLMEQFALKFEVHKRGSRFMIRYIRYMKGE